MVDWIDRLNDLARVDSLDSALTRLLLLPIAAFFVQAANAIEAGSEVIIEPLSTFGIGLSSVIDSFLGGSAEVINAGAGSTAGDVGVFGLLAFPAALLLVFVGAYVVANYLQQEETSDFLPLSFTDIPFLGVREED